MHLIRRFLVLVSCLVAFVEPSVAGIYLRDTGYEYQANSKAITILFVNGIRNERYQVVDSSESLIQSLYLDGLASGTYTFEYFHNPTDGLLDDSGEVAQQMRISDAYLALSQGNRAKYYDLLGKYYNQQSADPSSLPVVLRRVVNVTARLASTIRAILADSDGLVIVPHSQGNLYAEAAYAMLAAEGGSELLAKIRVVGVGVASATSPSDRHITHRFDEVIMIAEPFLAGALSLKTFLPLIDNEIACGGDPPLCGKAFDWSNIDKLAHSFGSVYLNKDLTSQASGKTFPATIYGYVALSLQELTGVQPPPPPPPFGTVTFVGRGKVRSFTAGSALIGSVQPFPFAIGDDVTVTLTFKSDSPEYLMSYGSFYFAESISIQVGGNLPYTLLLGQCAFTLGTSYTYLNVQNTGYEARGNSSDSCDGGVHKQVDIVLGQGPKDYFQPGPVPLTPPDISVFGNPAVFRTMNLFVWNDAANIHRVSSSIDSFVRQ